MLKRGRRVRYVNEECNRRAPAIHRKIENAAYANGGVRPDGGGETVEMRQVPPAAVEIQQMHLLPRDADLLGGCLLSDRRVRLRVTRGGSREGGKLRASDFNSPLHLVCNNPSRIPIFFARVC